MELVLSNLRSARTWLKSGSGFSHSASLVIPTCVTKEKGGKM